MKGLSPGVPFPVSRETQEGLQGYHALLLRWTERINLIARSTARDAWERHIADSLQLWKHRPGWGRSWIDLGSGGGLPGLVIAIVAKEQQPDLQMTLVESDQRKAAFLRRCAAELNLTVTILPRRIESLPPSPHDIVSARALAPLQHLLRLSESLRHDRTILLFPKGKTAHWELTEARRHWHIGCEEVPSRTDRTGTILKIFEVGPRA